MLEVLLLNASPKKNNSAGYRLMANMIDSIQQRQANLVVNHRDLAGNPLNAISADYADAILCSAPAQDAVFAQSEKLIDELERSDVVFITTPIHNFTGPATLKLWIDNVVRACRTFEAGPDGKKGLLMDRPVYILVSSGGFHRGPKARQPEFITPYLRHVLNSIGLFDIHFIYLQGMAGGDEAVAAAVQGAHEQLLLEPLFASLDRVTKLVSTAS